MAKKAMVPQILIGSKAIGQTKARRAVKRSVSAIRDMNLGALRERAEAKAADQRELRVLENALERMIERDAAARAVLGRLRRRRLDLKLRLNPAAQAPQPDEQLLSLHLQKRVSVVGPPYDYAWNWGNHSQQVSNIATGRIAIVAQSAKTGAAAAGIGLVLTTDQPASVTVRPFIHYEWRSRIRVIGLFSSASARGGIDASAWLDGALHTPVLRHQAFEHSGSSSDSRIGWGSAPVDQVGLSFAMTPGKVYAVNFGAWVECEDSPGLGGAGSVGTVDGVVQFIVVERLVM